MEDLLDTNPEIAASPFYATQPSIYNSFSSAYGFVISGVYTSWTIDRKRDSLYAAIEESSFSVREDFLVVQLFWDHPCPSNFSLVFCI